MATALNGKTKALMDLKYVHTGDLTSATEHGVPEHSQAWTNGTGVNQANRFWSEKHELVATTRDLDLYGSLTDSGGNTLNLTKVTEIWIKNNSDVAGENLVLKGNFVTVSMLDGHSVDPIGIVIAPGATYRLTNPIDGWTVTNTSADTITLDSGTDTIEYEISIIGRQ